MVVSRRKRLASIKLPEVVPEWVHAGGKVALGEISSELGALTGLLYGDGELGMSKKMMALAGR
jgi:hypothetical protein